MMRVEVPKPDGSMAKMLTDITSIAKMERLWPLGIFFLPSCGFCVNSLAMASQQNGNSWKSPGH